MSNEVQTNPIGRPPVYGQEQRQRFIQLVSEGWFDSEIHALPDMPSKAWIAVQMANDPVFATEVARAREVGSHVLAEKSVTIWDTEMPERLDGARASAWAHMIRGKSASLQWIAGKRNAVYADQRNVTITHKADVSGMSDDELLAHAARLGISGPLIDGVAQQVSVSIPGQVQNGDSDAEEAQINE